MKPGALTLGPVHACGGRFDSFGDTDAINSTILSKKGTLPKDALDKRSRRGRRAAPAPQKQRDCK